MPRVLWAQRKDIVYLTFEVVEVQNETIDTTATGITFSALQPSTGDRYACQIEFYDEIDPSQTQEHKTDRAITLVLKKADAEKPYWPRLVKSGKLPFVHTDFSRWRDEDELSEGDVDPSLGRGFGGGDMDFSQFANMAGSGGFPNMEDEDDDDSDEEDSEGAKATEEDPYQKTSHAALEEDSE